MKKYSTRCYQTSCGYNDQMCLYTMWYKVWCSWYDNKVWSNVNDMRLMNQYCQYPFHHIHHLIQEKTSWVIYYANKHTRMQDKRKIGRIGTPLASEVAKLYTRRDRAITLFAHFAVRTRHGRAIRTHRSPYATRPCYPHTSQSVHDTVVLSAHIAVRTRHGRAISTHLSPYTTRPCYPHTSQSVHDTAVLSTHFAVRTRHGRAIHTLRSPYTTRPCYPHTSQSAHDTTVLCVHQHTPCVRYTRNHVDGIHHASSKSVTNTSSRKRNYIMRSSDTGRWALRRIVRTLASYMTIHRRSPMDLDVSSAADGTLAAMVRRYRRYVKSAMYVD